MRFAIRAQRKGSLHETLAEGLQLLAFEGAPGNARWLDEAHAEALLSAQPEGNVAPAQGQSFIRRVTESYELLEAVLNDAAERNAKSLLESHLRVREASRSRGRTPSIAPFLPVDVLGIYIYLPVAE
jgi:hypothetical protein